MSADFKLFTSILILVNSAKDSNYFAFCWQWNRSDNLLSAVTISSCNDLFSSSIKTSVLVRRILTEFFAMNFSSLYSLPCRDRSAEVPRLSRHDNGCQRAGNLPHLHECSYILPRVKPHYKHFFHYFLSLFINYKNALF